MRMVPCLTLFEAWPQQPSFLLEVLLDAVLNNSDMIVLRNGKYNKQHWNMIKPAICQVSLLELMITPLGMHFLALVRCLKVNVKFMLLQGLSNAIDQNYFSF